MTLKKFVVPLFVIVLVACSVRADSSFFESLSNIVSYIADEKITLDQKLLKTSSHFEEKKLRSFGEPVVSTTSGDVIGSTLEEAHAFFSVPYAAPPIGSLRFRDPQPIKASEDPINATVPTRLVCPQRSYDECYAGHCLVNQNEDCLVLSVFVPRTVNLSNPIDNFPVLLWMHGGFFFAGGGTSPKYDGRWLSNTTQTIVVSINYRLGAFGFLVYNRGDDHLNGNQGLKDQRLAMTWVQQNIGNFGGDKDKVTIFGESAGAQSIMFHLLSDVSQPLYKRAILQSNAPIFPHHTAEGAMNVTQRLLNFLGCSGENEFQCLLNASTSELGQYPVIILASFLDGDPWSGLEPYRPILDGVEFIDQPLALFRAGKWNTEKEYIMGVNHEELDVLQFYFPDRIKLRRPLFRKINKMFFGEEIGLKVSKYYEDTIGPDGSDYSKLMGIEAGDAAFVCPSRAMMRLTYETADKPEKYYSYVFDHAPDGEYCHQVYPRNETCGYAYHTAEIPYIFRSGPEFGYYFNENDTDVADQFSKYWGNFARIGDPNNDIGGPSFDNAVYWPPYVNTEYPLPDVADIPYQIFGNGMFSLLPKEQVRNQASAWSNVHIQAMNPYIEARYKEDVCDFWDSLNFYVEFQNETETTTQTSTIKTTTMAPLSTTSAAKRTMSDLIFIGVFSPTLLLKFF